MSRAIRAEFLKLRRARAILWSALVVFIYNVINAVFVFNLKNPAASAQMAKAGGPFTKAALAGFYQPTWANFLRFIPQGISGAWGVLLFGFVAAYIFAQEYRERTAAATLTTPVRREYVAGAKMLVLAAWVLGLTLLSMMLGTAGVALAGIGGFTWKLIATTLLDSLEVSLLLYLTLPFVAWLAVAGKGYLRPMLFSVIALMLGNSLISTGAARWFPWDMPVLAVGASWMPVPPMTLVAGSWAVSVAVFAIGLFGLNRQMNRMDVAS